MRNRKKYNIPYFIFFSDTPIYKMSNKEEEKILSLCEEAYPDFTKIRAMQLEPVYDENKVMLNKELWEKAPIIGLFQMSVYGIDSSFPNGAMVVKNI